MPFLYLAITILVVAFIILAKSACIVPQKQAYLIERLGRYNATFTAGFHILIPFIDRIAYKRDLKEITIDVPPQQCVTRDNIIVDVDLLLGPKTEIYYPDKSSPIIRGLVSAQTPIHLGLDTFSEAFALKGDLALKGGEISFLGRSFYLREGKLSLDENESDFNPEISLRAELRERDADGTPIKIILSADKQKLTDLNPRLTSEPNRSEDELRNLLGAALFSLNDLEATSTASEFFGQVAASGIDFLIQNSLFRQIESRLRVFFHFDIFSFRTPFFQQALLQVFTIMQEKRIQVTFWTIRLFT